MSLLEALPDEASGKLRRRGQPARLQPMLATLTEERFSDRDWIFERKLDGERCLGFRRGSRIRLVSRTNKQLDRSYPELVEALREQHRDDFIVDGEIVAFDGALTSFARLQQRMQARSPEAARRTGVRVFHYLFDLLYVDGTDLTGLELRHRKALLRRAISFGGRLRLSIHRVGSGEAYHREACSRGWEGVVAKRADSEYTQRRSTDWLKLKCSNEQEFVIGGYTEPHGKRRGFGALLIGYHEDRELRYAGKVGTGYSEATLRQLGERLASLEARESPFASDRLPTKGVHWVRPKLVAEIAFTEWTRDGRLRHPRFVGLRRDKRPSEVVREAR